MSSVPPGENVRWQPLWGDAAVARARSILATRFYDDPDLEIMMMIDDDIVFKPADFWKVIEGARRTREIYSAGYMKHAANATLASAGFKDGAPIIIQPQAEPLPTEIRYAAAGFTAVHRDVIEAIARRESFTCADGAYRLHRCGLGAQEPMIPFFNTFTVQDPDGSYIWLSEDFAFCELAQQVGSKIWLDRSIVLGHMTEHALTSDGRFGPANGSDILELGGFPSPTTPVSLTDALPSDIAAFGEMHIAEVRAALSYGDALLGKVHAEKPEDQSELEWSLRDDVGRAMILAYAARETSGQQLPNILDTEGKRVLVYGAGIGTTALHAAAVGADVTVYEPNRQLQSFIHWRGERHSLPLTLAEEPGDLVGPFDVIFSNDSTVDLLGLFGPDGGTVRYTDQLKAPATV